MRLKFLQTELPVAFRNEQETHQEYVRRINAKEISSNHNIRSAQKIARTSNCSLHWFFSWCWRAAIIIICIVWEYIYRSPTQAVKFYRCWYVVGTKYKKIKHRCHVWAKGVAQWKLEKYRLFDTSFESCCCLKLWQDCWKLRRIV